MKRNLLYLLMVSVCLVTLQPARAISSSMPVVPSGTEPAVKSTNPFNDLLVKKFLELSPREYEKLTGKDMKLSQKISFKLAQWKIKRMLKKGKTVDLMSMAKKGIDTSDFNIAGFLLGFFLSLIGVLIAYLIDDEAMIKWAWLGAGLSLLIWLLAILL
jgi:hypothetical protein